MSKMRNIAAILGRTEAANTDNSPGVDLDDKVADSSIVNSILAGSTMAVYSSLDSLPAQPTAGSQAFVTGNQRLYTARNSDTAALGSGWYNVALINATPTLSLSASGTIALTAGSATTITMTAADSDNSNANLVLSLESGGDLFKFATVSQDSSVVTITPRTQDSATTLGSDGSATLTFKASDGISVASVQNTFTLSFGPDWASGSVTKTEPTYSNAGNQNRFLAMTPDGNYVISGDYANSRVNVQYYNGSSWSEQATFQNNDDPSAGTYMGTSIAISNDATYMAVGASAHNAGGNVYVFTRSGSTWSQQAKLAASDAATGDYFVNVSTNSDMTQLCIGASSDDGSGSNSGGAYIFTRSGTSWTQKCKFYSSDIAASDAFGYHTRSSSTGDFVVISAPQENSNQGAVYTFNITNSGATATQQQKLTASNGSTNSGRFGWALALSGDANYIAVGDRKFNSDTGQVVVYAKSGSTFSQQQIITSSDIQSGDQFGAGVALNNDGTLLAVTAWEEDGGSGDPNANDGSLYIFERDGTTWTQIKVIRAAAIFADAASATTGMSEVVGSSDFSRLAIAGGGGTDNISILDV